MIYHQTIYRFIQAQIDCRKDYFWCHLLPRSKSERSYRGRKGAVPHP